MGDVFKDGDVIKVGDWLRLLKEAGDHDHQEYLRNNIRNILQSGIDVLAETPSQGV